MRVAFYARVSTERQQQAQTIEQQVARLREYVASHDGYSVQEEHIFRDDGYSGATLKRPGLDALRDQAAQAAFEDVLVTAPDRLARNYVHQMVLLEELTQRGCPVQFIDHPLGNGPHDHLVVQIRGAVAEYERTLIADRMRRGRQAKLRSGQLLPWTRAPYGYRLDPERPRDPTLVRTDAAEAALVQDLFMTYAAGEATLWALAKGLTDRGVLSPTGRHHWTPSSIRGILINPCYTGLAVSGRWQVVPARQRASALRPIGSGWSHSTRAHPQAEQITIPVPALVSAEQFALVQQRLATNQQLALRSTTHEYLLRGLISCGRCRLQCTGRQNHHAERYRYYVCRGKQHPTSSSHDDRCPARFIPAAQLDDLVWTDLCQVLQHPEHLRQALDRAKAGAWLPDELRRRQLTLRGIQEALARQRERLLEAYLAEVVELAEFERKDGELRHRQEDLARQERELAVRSQRQLEVSVLAQSMIEICERLSCGLAHATFAQRRQLIELLIDRVVVTDGAVEIRYVIPTTDASTHTRFCHLRTDYFNRPAVIVGADDALGKPMRGVGDKQEQAPRDGRFLQGHDLHPGVVRQRQAGRGKRLLPAIDLLGLPGGTRQPLEVRHDLLPPPAIRQVDAIQPEARDPGEPPRPKRLCQGFREIPRVEDDGLKEEAKPTALLDEPQRQLMFRDAARRLQPEPHGEVPARRDPVRGHHHVPFDPLLGLGVLDDRDLLHRFRIHVVLEDRVVDDQKAAAGLGEAGVLFHEPDQSPHDLLGRPGGFPEEPALGARMAVAGKEVIEGLHREAGRHDQPNDVLGKVLELVGSTKTIPEAVQQFCPHRRNAHHRPHRRLLLRRSCDDCCVESVSTPSTPKLLRLAQVRY